VGNSITAAEVLLALKTLKVAMKSDLKCAKPGTEEFFGLVVCVKWPGDVEDAAFEVFTTLCEL